MKQLTILVVVLLSTQLCGCVGASISAATLAVRAAPRDELRPLAEDGDAAAQYELGKSYCCMGVGFDTQKATEWLCESAHQGNADAMFELGRIYMGQLSRTPSPGQKARQLVMTKSYPAYAHMWLSLATTTDYPDAAKLLARVDRDITSSDKLQSQRMQESWQNAPCDYDSVLGSAGA